MFKKTLAFASASYLLLHRDRVLASPEPPVYMLLRGEYENKIRRFSPPEKIFDVFATIDEKGKLLMTMKDLLKAICFYNYSISDQQDTIGYKPQAILNFLAKNDKFQIYDYFLLARFIAFQRSKIQSFFKKNKTESLDKHQFLLFLKQECYKDYSQFIKPNMIMESRQFKPKVEQFQQRLEEVSENIFKCRDRMGCDEIIELRRSMIYELYEFEFLMFPIKEGCIDGVDFARSIVKYVEPNKTKKFMQRIKTIEGIKHMKIDKQAYQGFHMYMQTNMHELKELLIHKGAIKADQFSNLINRYVKQDFKVEREEIEIITKLLDTDNSGFLEKAEILGVLKNLEYYTTVKTGENTFVENLKKDFETCLEKGKKIMEIIYE